MDHGDLLLLVMHECILTFSARVRGCLAPFASQCFHLHRLVSGRIWLSFHRLIVNQSQLAPYGHPRAASGPCAGDQHLVRRSGLHGLPRRFM